MKTPARETSEKQQQIISRALLNLMMKPDDERSANMPPEPNDLNELVIEGEWTTNGNVNNLSNFMLHDNGINAGECVIIFATEENLSRL